jgi:hypothetical protein
VRRPKRHVPISAARAATRGRVALVSSPGSASGTWRVSGQVAGVYAANWLALARDLPRFRLLSTGAWNRAGADVAPQDCSVLAAWPGVGEQVEHWMGWTTGTSVPGLRCVVD